MALEYGTKEEHLATAKRAKDNNVTSIWTGDIARNAYLRENLSFIQEENIATVTLEENYTAQESNYIIKWN